VYVPNYVPEPLEVPGNVTLTPYRTRVQFIRRVTYCHLIGLSVAGGLAFLPWPHLGWLSASLVLAGLLIGLDLLRIQLRGTRLEASVSTLFLPVVVALVGWCARELTLAQIPVWAAWAGVVCSAVYSVACGRDYSFVGGYMLALIPSSMILAAVSIQARFGVHEAAWALSFNAIYLFYFAYDLASLMARRREDEVLAGVVDLHRDVFNFFGYFVRVIRHWKKHRIWVQPR